MISALSIVAVFTIVVFLGGAAFGAFMVFVVSIHRTSRAPLSEIDNARGALSRQVLTSARTNCRESDQ
jgi:hypothetical protein